MSNLATPAPKVEPATAEKAAKVGQATADQAVPVEEALSSAATPVGPAVTGSERLDETPATAATTTTDSSPLSVVALRGGSGSDFESYAGVLRGAPEKNFLQLLFPCIYDERNFVTYGEVKKYVLVKGSVCFVFGTETDLQPYYAIELEEMFPIQEIASQLDPTSVTVSPLPGSNLPRPEMKTILLKYKSNKNQAFQFTFDTKDDADLAQRFYNIVVEKGKKDEKTTPPLVSESVAVAAKAGKEAVKAQPEI